MSLPACVRLCVGGAGGTGYRDPSGVMQLAGCVTRGRQEGLLRGVCPGLLAGQPGATLPHDCQGTLSQWPRCPLPLWGWGGDPRRDCPLAPESAPPRYRQDGVVL